MRHEVIMPALGMTQDSGLLLAWKKQVGEEVVVGDILMEVETDKSTMEVEAQHSGFLTILYAEEGTEVPVGEVIAIISATTEGTDETSPGSHSETTMESDSSITPLDVVTETDEEVPPKTPTKAQNNTPGKILASPKFRRLARERGLDFGLLVQSGYSQPYHVSDLKTLEAMSPAQTTGLEIYARAHINGSAFKEFEELLKVETGLPITVAMAAFAAGAYHQILDSNGITVRVDTLPNSTITYMVPNFVKLREIIPSEMGINPDLIVTDLTLTKLVNIKSGPALVPTFSISNFGQRLEVLLVSPQSSMDQHQLVNCIEEFINRLELPLMHLL